MKPAFCTFASQTATPATQATRATQRDIWLACQQHKQAPLAFLDCVVLQFGAPVNAAVLNRALNRLEDAHPALRSVFTDDGTGIEILPPRHRDLPVTNVARESSRDIASLLQQLSDKATLSPLPLDGSPLWRAHLVSCANNAWLLLTFHRAIIDAASRNTLIWQLVSLMTAQAVAISASASPHVDRARYRKALDHWRSQFPIGLPPCHLPVDKPRASAGSLLTSTITTELPGSLSEKIKLATRKAGVKHDEWFLAAYAVFLHRLSGDEELVIGLPVRDSAVPADAVGQFSGIMPIRFALQTNASYSRVLAEVIHQRHARDIHPPVSLDELVADHSEIEFAERHQRTTVLDYQPQPLPDGLEVLSSQADLHPWTLSLYPTANGTGLSCRYNQALFRPESVELRLMQWCHLLAELAECPEQPVGSVSIGSQRNHSLQSAFERAETARVSAQVDAVRAAVRR